MADLKKPTPTWDEQENGLLVQFPRIDDPDHPGCAWAMLVVVSLMLIPVPLYCLIAQPDMVHLLVLIVVELIVAWLWWSCFRATGERAEAPKPSTLLVKDGELKIERAGAKGELDVSWSLAEITDIRLCPTHDDWEALHRVRSPLSIIMETPGRSLIRISVRLPSDVVEDAVVVSAGEYWTNDLEERLRRYLGLDKESGESVRQ